MALDLTTRVLPPDELVSDVAECFHVEGVLVLNYCLTPAWG